MPNINYDIAKMEKKLKKYLDTSRFIHTQGVMYTSGALAMRYGLDMESAMGAGLLHDCAKCIPNDKKIRLCEKNQIPISSFERKNPFLLLAKLGAFITRKKYGINDESILSAITYHTTGRAMMQPLDKVIFTADYIEPHRDKAQNLPEIRQIAFIDLDECIYIILRDTLDYLSSNPKDIDTATEDAFRYYKQLHDKKQEEKGE